MKIPVYVFRGQDVNEKEPQIVIQTLNRLKQFKVYLEIQYFNDGCGDARKHKNFTWYENRAWLPMRKQLDSERLLWDFWDESWELEPRGQCHVGHIDFAILNKDLTINRPHIKFLFGQAKEGTGAVISTFRFKAELKDEKLYEMCIRRLVYHEFLHILGLLPGWRESNTEDCLGKHCKNICVMRQALDVSKWARYAQEENENKIILCSECQGDLKQVLRRA